MLRVAALLKSRATSMCNSSDFKPLKCAEFKHDVKQVGSYLAYDYQIQHRLGVEIGVDYYTTSTSSEEERECTEQVAKRAIMRELLGDVENEVFQAVRLAYDGDKRGTIKQLEKLLMLLRGDEVAG
jgi:hypothetical protein